MMGSSPKTSSDWFDASKEGLRKLVQRRGVSFILYELAQNAWDTRASFCEITIKPVEGKRLVQLTVVDDDPDGFSDMAHAYTLFAESAKKFDPTKRGRFNLGEKLVLALCEEAKIRSTKGTVTFDEKGRHTDSARLLSGTMFKATLRITRDEMNEMIAAADMLLPPIQTAINGIQISSRTPRDSFEATLPTVSADEEGFLRPTRRKAAVRIYEVPEGRTGWIYEMGIPVCETGDPWDVEIMQKVPLNSDRDNVTPGYLQELRVAVVNALGSGIEAEEARSPAVQAALGDKRIEKQAVKTIVEHQFGPKAVVFDPRDTEANHRATADAYTVIPGGAYSKDQWKQIREASCVSPAGKMFPTPKPFSDDPNAPTAKFIPESDWTEPMRRVVAYAKTIAKALIQQSISVRIENEPKANHTAAYCSTDHNLTLNFGRLGHRWFSHDLWSERINSLLIHELAHEYESNHLSEGYYKACCRLGADLTVLALENPTLFEFEPNKG